jgi:hypothetical protein
MLQPDFQAPVLRTVGSAVSTLMRGLLIIGLNSRSEPVICGYSGIVLFPFYTNPVL